MFVLYGGRLEESWEDEETKTRWRRDKLIYVSKNVRHVGIQQKYHAHFIADVTSSF